jgi:hypothetical protein
MTNTLDQAIKYLGAVKVAEACKDAPAWGDSSFSRYAMQGPTGRWHTFCEATLAKFAEGPLNNFCYQVTIGRAFVLMPGWFSPTLPFALRNKEGDIAATYPSRDAARNGMIEGDRLITCDLETGEEVTC